MKSKIVILSVFCFFLTIFQCEFNTNESPEFRKLLCEYASNPVNVDIKNPRFSWIIESFQRGAQQTAFQILVASSSKILQNNEGDMWDSGVIKSSSTIHHLYEGKKLKSNTTYFWKIRVWIGNDSQIESDIAKFSTALYTQEEWIARWIGAGPVKEPRSEAGFFKSVKEQYVLSDTIRHHGRSGLFRKEITCPKGIKKATVFVSGLGYYELFINGSRISEFVLNPAKTHYRKQVLYDTYDVTACLNKNANVIGLHLGNGWYNPYKKWWRPYRMQWFGAKRTILQMHVEFNDGSSRIYSTDDSWKTTPGPVLFNCVYDGEVYDANQESAGWSETGYDDSGWDFVNIVEPPGGEMVSQMMPPIKVIQTLKPVKKYTPKPGVFVYDMGQNFTGWARMTVKGKKGTKVRIRFAEEINENGELDVKSNEGAKATAVYILKGDGIENYEPRFTFFGFRYAEITAEPDMPIIQNVEGCVVHSACDPTGEFECGNTLINKIHHATIWSQKSNMIGYPLDCPQRDERLGWFGDAQVTAEEALFNFDMALFYKNWLSGIKVNQDEKTGDIPIISPRPYIWDEGVEWSSTYFTLLWDYYKYYGDVQILAEHYETMKRYMDFLHTISKNYILPQGWIGDWGSLVEGWKEGQPESVPTAFYYYDSIILSKIATILNNKKDAALYQELAQTIKDRYNQTWFDKVTKNYNDGSQMANAFPLLLGIVPEQYKKAVLENIVTDVVDKNKGHLTAGVLGTKYVIDAFDP